MPVLTIRDLEGISPVFKGAFGNAVGRGLMHLTNIDDVNALYERCAGHEGPDFTDALLKDQGVEYRVGGWRTLDNLPPGAFITVSNHPYGGLDGIMLIDLIGHLRRDYKVMVNKFLSYIRALGPSFITVIPTGKERGAPQAESIHGVKLALEQIQGGSPVGFFPSGAVSDLNVKEKSIRDRRWQPSVLRLIRKAHVPIIPIRFFDRNSDFFYALGLIDWRIRTLRLPSEVVNKGGKPARIGVGDIISTETQDQCASLDEFGDMLRSSVYDMPLPEDMVSRTELFKHHNIIR